MCAYTCHYDKLQRGRHGVAVSGGEEGRGKREEGRGKMMMSFICSCRDNNESDSAIRYRRYT